MNEKAKHYLSLHEKYLRDADELLEAKDHAQASEKLWGAAAEVVKAVAAERSIELKTHADLWNFVTKLREEMKDPDISKLFLAANYLHQNFYENLLPPEAVIDGSDAVKQFAARLRPLTDTAS